MKDFINALNPYIIFTFGFIVTAVGYLIKSFIIQIQTLRRADDKLFKLIGDLDLKTTLEIEKLKGECDKIKIEIEYEKEKRDLKLEQMRKDLESK